MKNIVTAVCVALCFTFAMAMALSIAHGDLVRGLWLFVIAFVFGYIAVHVGLTGKDET